MSYRRAASFVSAASENNSKLSAVTINLPFAGGGLLDNPLAASSSNGMQLHPFFVKVAQVPNLGTALSQLTEPPWMIRAELAQNMNGLDPVVHCQAPKYAYAHMRHSHGCDGVTSV